MQQPFLIRIGKLEYQLDGFREAFCPVDKEQKNAGRIPIPLGRFRIETEDWYILWDKRTQSFYNPLLNIHPFPLTVEWIRVEILSADAEEKERITLLVLLSETVETIRQQNGSVKKAGLHLRKAIDQFNSKIN